MVAKESRAAHDRVNAATVIRLSVLTMFGQKSSGFVTKAARAKPETMLASQTPPSTQLLCVS